MLEMYKRKPFEGNPTKEKKQRIITIKENVKHIQNIIKTKKFQQVKMILKIKLYKVKVLRSEQ